MKLILICQKNLGNVLKKSFFGNAQKDIVFQSQLLKYGVEKSLPRSSQKDLNAQNVDSWYQNFSHLILALINCMIYEKWLSI